MRNLSEALREEFIHVGIPGAGFDADLFPVSPPRNVGPRPPERSYAWSPDITPSLTPGKQDPSRGEDCMREGGKRYWSKEDEHGKHFCRVELNVEPPYCISQPDRSWCTSEGPPPPFEEHLGTLRLRVLPCETSVTSAEGGTVALQMVSSGSC